MVGFGGVRECAGVRGQRRASAVSHQLSRITFFDGGFGDTTQHTFHPSPLRSVTIARSILAVTPTGGKQPRKVLTVEALLGLAFVAFGCFLANNTPTGPCNRLFESFCGAPSPMHAMLSRLIDSLKRKADTSGLEVVDDAIVFRYLRVFERLVREGVYPQPPELLSRGRPSVATLVHLAQEGVGDSERCRVPFDVAAFASWCARCTSLGRFCAPCGHVIYARGCYILTRGLTDGPWWPRDTSMYLRLDTLGPISGALGRAVRDAASARAPADADIHVTAAGATEIAELLSRLTVGVRRLALSIGGETFENAIRESLRSSLVSSVDRGRVYEASAAVSLINSLRTSLGYADRMLGTSLVPRRVAAQAGRLGAAPHPATSAAEFESRKRLAMLPSPIGMGSAPVNMERYRAGAGSVLDCGDGGGGEGGDGSEEEGLGSGLGRMSLDGDEGAGRERDEDSAASPPASPPRLRARYLSRVDATAPRVGAARPAVAATDTSASQLQPPAAASERAHLLTSCPLPGPLDSAGAAAVALIAARDSRIDTRGGGSAVSSAGEQQLAAVHGFDCAPETVTP